MADRATTPIRLLEAEPNAKGNLFTRLTEDLLLVLGYESLRSNVHHAGREIDLVARHRTEERRAIVECKATKDLIGGDALNKFFGALDLERLRMVDVPVEGYFVSLAGFRGTAIEQEVDAAAQRFVLMDGHQVAEQLVQGGVLISEREAAALAASVKDDVGELLDQSELLGCRLGWIWCVYFGTAGHASRFALVHAGGTVLPRAIALEVVAQDTAAGGRLGQLELIAPPPATTSTPSVGEAHATYVAHLQQEFGYITLEGLPADQELGSRRIVLDDLFVPLRLLPYRDELHGPVGDEEARPDESQEDEEGVVRGNELRLPVSTVLSLHRQVAILAVPGGGKSTLLKHLATVPDDADPDDAERLPVVIRCRQLRTPDAPLLEIIKEIPHRGEFPQLAAAFEALVEDALLTGRLTVLIDGLDEIADDRGRVAFARQLRTFSSRYPEVQMIVTSRPGGYRAVAGVLAPACAAYRIADFDDDDILSLTKSWHRAVLGTSGSVQEDAEALAARIIATDRVRRLATNPLLLTTLLLVKRWVGDLPRKRSVLYARAIEVLLMTWNVEGHEPIEQDEALPQLAYVAYEMTAGGEQTISEPRLRELLRQARDAMPDILGYTKVGIGEFIRRIEDRSSVLSLSGHAEESGRVVAQYEFKHLTFQEYLTALAITDSFCVPRLEGASLVETLDVDGRLTRPEWTEVVLLAGVLAGREAGALVQHLIDAAERHRAADVGEIAQRLSAEQLLARCLADEVQITPGLAEAACRIAGRGATGIGDPIDDVLDSRFGPTLRAISYDALRAGGEALDVYANANVIVALRDFAVSPTCDIADGPWADEIVQALDSEDWPKQAQACLALMHVAFAIRTREGLAIDPTRLWARARAERVTALLPSPPEGRSFSAAWALAWLGVDGLLPPNDRLDVLLGALACWRDRTLSLEHRRIAAWAFSAVPLLPRDVPELVTDRELLLPFALEELDADTGSGVERRHAALVAGYYLRGPWPDAELLELCREGDHDGIPGRVIDALGG